MNLCPELRRLQAEHARWLAELSRPRREGDDERAARLVALWAEEILPHCRREEDVLVPELARRLSEADATVMFTLVDHVALRRLARELRDARGLARRDLAARLERKLIEHLAFEERTLFPSVQEQLGCDRLAALGPELSGGAPPAPRAKATRPGRLRR